MRHPNENLTEVGKACPKMKVAIIGSRGYPYVYSGYETFVKELSERLTRNGIDLTVYCHRNLFTRYPKQVNGINLVYLSTIERKTLSQFIHSFQAMIHATFRGYDVILVVNSVNGPFGIFTKLSRERIKAYPEREPLLGWYDYDSTAVAEQHIQWMHDYGID